MSSPAQRPATIAIMRAPGVQIDFTSAADWIRATGDISGAGEAIPISRLVGLPLLAVKLEEAGAEGSEVNGDDSHGRGQSERQGSVGAALFAKTDVSSADFGRVDVARWGRGVVVCREDGGELLVQHVEALCVYCKDDLGPAFEFSAEMGDDEVLREDVQGLISKERFAAFWEMYRAKQNAREGWADVKGPFDT